MHTLLTMLAACGGNAYANGNHAITTSNAMAITMAAGPHLNLLFVLEGDPGGDATQQPRQALVPRRQVQLQVAQSSSLSNGYCASLLRWATEIPVRQLPIPPFLVLKIGALLTSCQELCGVHIPT